MTQTPAGWYADPDPGAPPGRLRYWDGAGWTDHLHQPTPQQQPETPAYPGAYPGSYPSSQPSGQPDAAPTAYPTAYPGYPAAGSAGYAPAVPSTPDGVPLAGWWWRVLAYVLDGILSLPLLALAAIPALASQWSELGDWFDAVQRSVEDGTPRPANPDVLDPTTGPGLFLVLSLLVGTVLYAVVFLRWKQATPGKLITGLRVRRRDDPGLPWGSIVARVGFVTALSIVGQIPIIGILAFLVVLLDYLWPLWDPRKQALHDKVAGTNVVRPR
jgi:uncharacterized RDD family membrane protein YckC